jgi:predicted ATPase/class 3 adenylate cyclase/DNA-binding CsgD family transcriptional regulator
MGAELPSGTVTLLLGDVEGSSQMWDRDASGARSAMAGLQALVDELVGTFDGARPLEQGEGDSFVAAFTRPSDAIAFALEIQRRLGAGLTRVRIGIHTGEVELREDGRYDGPTIIRTARLRDMGHGGQTLVSDATRILAQDALPDDAGVLDLGTHRLKGLDRPEHVWQLTHPDLGAEFPPLRSVEAKKGNLPVQLTSFVGREAEVAEVQQLIATNRHVTLTGAGGCGKTRLAIESIARLDDGFDDGVWFCDLGPLADPDALAQTLRVAMGLREDPLQSDVHVLCAHLAESDALIVIDNCEHLIEASAALADSLLRSCAHVTVLTTSREPVGVPGEVSWRVPSLSMPDDAASPAELEKFDAIRLFVERARQVRPGFAVTAENASAVVEICARLEGIPLAIELAAARVRVLSVHQVVEGLNDRFRLLGRGARTLLARQQTLEASVGWSHDLLTEAQRIVLRRLSVFAGSFSLEAAENVVAGDDVDPAEVLELVTQLVDRSLVVADEATGEVRYRLLETIRHYARQRLVDSGEASAIAARHLDWNTAWARMQFVPYFAGQRGFDEVVTRIDGEYDNIRAAVEWAIVGGNAEAGIRLAVCLQGQGAGASGLRDVQTKKWLETLLQSSDLSDKARCDGWLALATVESFVGAPDAIAQAGMQALSLARSLESPRRIAEALQHVGFGEMMIDPAAGIRRLDESIAIARENGHVRTLVAALFSKTSLLGWAGPQAVAALDELRALGAERSPVLGAPIRAGYGAQLVYAGRIDEGEAEIRIGEAEIEATDNRYWRPIGALMLGIVAALRGNRTDSSRCFDEGIRAAEEAGFARNAGVWQAIPTIFATQDGDFERVERYVERILASFSGFGAMWRDEIAALAGTSRAVARVAAGDLPGARELIATGIEPSKGLPAFVVFSSFVSPIHALVVRALGEIAEAESHAHSALEDTAEKRIWVFAPDALDVAAALRGDVGADVDAVRLFAAADAARTRMGTVRAPNPIFDAGAEIATVRERLGEESFSEAWTEGEALSIEDAVAYATRGRGPRQRPATGWDALTPTELKVVALVAEGLSNPQIAERLFISRRTVSTHLTHVFAKLGVSSRAELATEATKRAI